MSPALFSRRSEAQRTTGQELLRAAQGGPGEKGYASSSKTLGAHRLARLAAKPRAPVRKRDAHYFRVADSLRPYWTAFLSFLKLLVPYE